MLDRVVIRYLPVEDRLELAIITKPPVKLYRLHLTRRVTRLWLDQLAKVIEVSAAAPATAEPTTRAAIAALHHEALASRASFGRSDLPALEQSLETAPVQPSLVTRISCGRRKSDGLWTLRFGFVSGGVVSLNLTAETLHGAVELLTRQLEKTDWRLNLPLARQLHLAGGEGPVH